MIWSTGQLSTNLSWAECWDLDINNRVLYGMVNNTKLKAQKQINYAQLLGYFKWPSIHLDALSFLPER